MAPRKSAATSTVATMPVENAVKKPIVPKDIDLSTFVIVRNGFQGKLVYISRRTGEKFTWDGFGDEQAIELRELVNAKSSAKKFFENNWFMFDSEYRWVVDYLGVNRYYKYALNLDEFDSIFAQSPDTIKGIIDNLSSGQKRSVAYRARQLVINNEIDSLKLIHALEEALDIELIEK